jgi:hypothetical protein
MKKTDGLVKNKHRSIWIYALDICIPLLCYVVWRRYDIPVIVINEVIKLVFIYLLARVLFSLLPKYKECISVIAISLICLYECGLGYLQLVGKLGSNHYLYTITGSFGNPGPYGGFIAVCISMLVAYCIKKRGSYKEKVYSRILFWMVAVVAILASVILPSTQSRSAILALVCSLLYMTYGIESIKSRLKPILTKYGIWIFVGVVVIASGAYLFKKQSADGRFFMDRMCIKAIYESGGRGVGFGHFGSAYADAQHDFFQKKIERTGKDDLDWTAIDKHDRMTADCPDNAFNEYMFVGVEFGVAVMLLFIGVIAFGIITSFKSGTIWCYGLTAFAVFALFSYPLHVKQFQILFAVLLAISITDGDKGKDILGFAILIAPILLLAVVLIKQRPNVNQYRKAELSWKKTERWHQMEYYDYTVEGCDTLWQYKKYDKEFLFAYGQSLNKIGEYEKSDSILKMGTEISSDPMFWNVMGNNSLAMGRYREAEERYKHAFYMVPNRLYPLNLLAKLYYAESDTARFLDMADRVETFIPKVESTSTAQLRDEIRLLKTDILLKQEP